MPPKTVAELSPSVASSMATPEYAGLADAVDAVLQKPELPNDIERQYFSEWCEYSGHLLPVYYDRAAEPEASISITEDPENQDHHLLHLPRDRVQTW